LKKRQDSTKSLTWIWDNAIVDKYRAKEFTHPTSLKPDVNVSLQIHLKNYSSIVGSLSIGIGIVFRPDTVPVKNSGY